MAQDFIFERKSSGSDEPKTVGEILDEILRGDSNFASAYRKYKEAMTVEKDDEEHLFKDIHPNTELGIDLKLFTREPGRMEIGAFLDGAITHDGEDHFTFIQNAGEKKKVDVTQRNPHVYEGKRINVNRKDDGTLYPTFNRPRYNEKFTFQDFCREAADELYMIAGCFTKQNSGLVEEGGSK